MIFYDPLFYQILDQLMLMNEKAMAAEEEY